MLTKIITRTSASYDCLIPLAYIRLNGNSKLMSLECFYLYKSLYLAAVPIHCSSAMVFLFMFSCYEIL